MVATRRTQSDPSGHVGYHQSRYVGDPEAPVATTTPDVVAGKPVIVKGKEVGRSASSNAFPSLQQQQLKPKQQHWQLKGQEIDHHSQGSVNLSSIEESRDQQQADEREDFGGGTTTIITVAHAADRETVSSKRSTKSASTSASSSLRKVSASTVESTASSKNAIEKSRMARAKAEKARATARAASKVETDISREERSPKKHSREVGGETNLDYEGHFSKSTPGEDNMEHQSSKLIEEDSPTSPQEIHSTSSRASETSKSPQQKTATADSREAESSVAPGVCAAETREIEESNRRSRPVCGKVDDENFWSFFGFAEAKESSSPVGDAVKEELAAETELKNPKTRDATLWDTLVSLIDPVPELPKDATTKQEQQHQGQGQQEAQKTEGKHEEESVAEASSVALFSIEDFKSLASVKDDEVVSNSHVSLVKGAADASIGSRSEGSAVAGGSAAASGVEMRSKDYKVPDPIFEVGEPGIDNRSRATASTSASTMTRRDEEAAGPASVVNVTNFGMQEADAETLTQTEMGTTAGTEPSTVGQKKKKKVDKSLETRRIMLVEELRSAISSFGRYDIRCANISAALGDVLDESEEYEQAIKLHTDAVTIYSCKLGDDHTTTMNAKLRLGTVLENAGQYDEAIKTFYLVTVMLRTLKGEQCPAAADGLVHMASALRKKGDYMQAIKELKRALKIFRDALGDAHEKVSATVDEIASLYVTVGDFEKSAAILEEVVKLKAATLGAGSKEVAVTLCTLATTYECSEQFTQSMKALKKAYKIYTDVYGYSSQDATTTLNRIAHLYEATGDYNRASIAYLGVLRGRKLNLGTDHLLVGETYYRLGHSLRETGQLDKALKCMREALPIFVGKSVEMNDVKMIAEIMHEMACINKEKKQYKDASRIFKQEISVRRKIGQSDYPHVARALNSLGEAEFELQNNSRALKYLVEALTIYQEHGEQGVDCAEVLYNTGLVFEAVRNKDRALEAFVEAARIFKEHEYGGSHPKLLKANMKIDEIRSRFKDGDSKSADGSVLKRIFVRNENKQG